ncbi:hypothetical protein [Streptomyces sp. NBC_00582]|uniref:hypothetical protein n=1 Tax=Streptomyces sp. NBC_00582 TaxID=2975783 RepID=UPI002E81DF36|nr:hypothetical protein [Streptomyces sp. NBC_00582]WUB64467.1 hypothetical protein OG852_30765 [Streptomyces sp. NBC_00582]
MTAPATRPTPAVFARRKPQPPAAPSAPAPRPPRPTAAEAPAEPQSQDRPLTAADAIRPGKIRKSEILRPLYERGLRTSRMLPEARLVGLTLLGYANFQSGVLHAEFRPTPEQLADATGLTPRQVLVQIEVLTSRGWLRERTIAKGPNQGVSVLQLCIPVAVLQLLRDDREHARATTRSGTTR